MSVMVLLGLVSLNSVIVSKIRFCGGAQKLMEENPKVFWAEFSFLS
jgi:hypothetical protein